MKNVIKDAEGKLSTIIEKLSDVVLKEVQSSKSEDTLFDISDLLTEKGSQHPNINSSFFKSTIPEKNWWEDNRNFVGFALLIALSAFVFCNCFCFLSDKEISSGNLLFFFGVIVILFVGLVIVALFTIKASAKHRAEKNERKNKLLAFRLRMLETAFNLENRKIIAEKLCIEKGLFLKEKECLYSLDEKQRESEHNRKIQLKQFEILEDYMKHLAELAKTGQQNTWNIDLLQIFGFITKEDQPAQNDDESNEDAESGDEKPDENKGNNTTEPPVAPLVPSDEEPAPGEDDHATVEEKTEADQAPEDVDPNHVEEPSDAKPEE